MRTIQTGRLRRPTDHSEKETLTIQETAVRIGCDSRLVTDAIRSGQIPAIRVGKRYFIPKAALDRLLRQGAEPANDTAR